MNSFKATKNIYFSIISDMIYFDCFVQIDYGNHQFGSDWFEVFGLINHVGNRTILNYSSYQIFVIVSICLLIHIGSLVSTDT